MGGSEHRLTTTQPRDVLMCDCISKPWRSNMMKQIIAAIFLFAFVAQIDAFYKRANDDVSNDNRHLFPQNMLR